MAVINPRWSYWACAFPAILLNPMGADASFTVSDLLISSVFPPKTQALAGGVFNTIAQLGKSVGLMLSVLIANSVTAQSSVKSKNSPEALITGYRGVFWFFFGLCATTLCISFWGLRKIGKVGQKKD